MSSFLTIVLLWFWKPWAGAYVGEKGKNFARKEDLDIILAEVRAITITQKEIEAKISGELWNRQMVWNQRRDAYAGLLKAMDRDMERVSSELAQERDGIAPFRVLTATQLAENLEDLFRCMDLVEIFGGNETPSILAKLHDSLLSEGTNSVERHETALKTLRDARALLIKQAKTDLVREG
jgi:hypothetical protein